MIDSPIALVVVLLAIVAVPVLMGRSRRGTGDGLRVVARAAVSKGSMVAVVTVDERRMLIGASDRGIRLIAELDSAPHDDDDPTTTTTGHGTHLGGGDAPSTGTSRSGQIGADARTALASPAEAAIGPGTGLIDRLRVMTVRTPTAGRPIRVPFRR